MIECKKLGFVYAGSQSRTLSDFTFHFQAGKHYLIKGEHGSGKSTLMKILASEKFSFAQGQMQGDVLHFTPQNRILFLDAQVSELFFYEKIFDEFYYTLRCLGYPKSNIETQVLIIMDYFHISHWRNRELSSLSMGEKQYIALILAISTKQYNLMCLDEPFLHLDLTHKLFILQYLEQISQDLGTSMIVIDHQDDGWNEHFHFEEVTLVPAKAYAPWYERMGKEKIPSFASQWIDFSGAPLQKIQNHEVMITPGRVVGINGRNGAGKTTMCKYLMGMFDKKINAQLCKRMLFAETKTMYFYTSLEKEWADAPEHVTHPYADMHPQHLSYGQNKIEMFQRLIADKPQLLILDDPYDGFNQTYQNYMWAQIQQLKEMGAMIIIAATDIDCEKGVDEVLEV